MHIRPHLKIKKASVGMSATDAFFNCTLFSLINGKQESGGKRHLLLLFLLLHDR